MQNIEEDRTIKDGQEMMIMERKKIIIQWNDIVERVNAVRHACKALEHLNKRAKYLVNYVKIHRVSIFTILKQINYYFSF